MTEQAAENPLQQGHGFENLDAMRQSIANGWRILHRQGTIVTAGRLRDRRLRDRRLRDRPEVALTKADARICEDHTYRMLRVGEPEKR
jgi:hypothetical protein